MTNNKACTSRQGFILVATLAIMTVLVSILLPLIPRSLANRRLVREDLVRLQADFVLRAAVERALIETRENDSYTGDFIELNLATSSTSETKQNFAGSPPKGSLQGTLSIQRNEKSLEVQLKLNSGAVIRESELSSEVKPNNDRPQISLNKSWDLSNQQPELK